MQRERIGESPQSIRNVNRILDPEILTIGFARRFATYKRGSLLFSDKERLKKLLNDTTRPVQFIFAGKAHPRDEGGKALIQEVYKFSRETGFENRIVFVEDYDSYIARRLEPQSCGCGTRIAAADLGKRLGGLNLAGFGYHPCCDPLGQQVGRKRD